MEVKQYTATPFGVTIIDYEDNKINIEKAEIADCFEKYGGGFLKAIGVALRKADSNNTKILLKAFDFYVKEYIEQFILPNQK